MKASLDNRIDLADPDCCAMTGAATAPGADIAVAPVSLKMCRLLLLLLTEDRKLFASPAM